jgi:hypothetical protein
MKRAPVSTLVVLLALVGGGRAQLPPGAVVRGVSERPDYGRIDSSLLERPIEPKPTKDQPQPPAGPPVFQVPGNPPAGFTGRSSVAPTEVPEDGHFIPVEDRWRIGMPEWDRYGKDHPKLDDYPLDIGRIWDPYNQNVLKGDFPILGQNVFLDLTAVSFSLAEPRLLPTATTPFESTKDPGQREFFGNPNQFLYQHNLFISIDLFHGDAAFKQPDWRIKITPTFNSNNLLVSELAVVSPDVQEGSFRYRTFSTLQEWFIEKKLADLSPNFDFVSVRLGSQPFVSDFRGFIFNDVNRAARLFGSTESNRNQFNLIYFDQQEKDTNSFLNTFSSRNQRILIANFYRQDFLWPGYTMQASVHYNHDDPSFKFDKNLFLVRPDPVGQFQPHGLNVVYLGLAGEGHINRFNISNTVYLALGRDSNNPLAGRPQDINAMMAAIELSYDRDYTRFRTSYFYSSGDGNPNNSHATGFDSILDGPNFAGTFFSYWGRQNIPLFGVNLKQRFSLIPDLRSSKIQGQSNFVNPGLHLINLGWDVDVTPKIKLVNNYNFMWFDKTAPLETFLFQGNIDRWIGADLSMGVEYRPLLSNNIVMAFGVATLLPGKGFKDIYDRFNANAQNLIAGFGQLELQY